MIQKKKNTQSDSHVLGNRM